MRIEDQVANLELSFRVHELGVNIESLFYWTPSDFKADGWDIQSLETRKNYPRLISGESVSAFTVAELGEMLPKWYASYRVNEDSPISFKTGMFWRCEGGDPFHKEAGKSEADSRAKMIIYLIENKIITTTEAAEGRG